MRRRTFDILMATAGLFLAATLVFAGVMAALGPYLHRQ